MRLLVVMPHPDDEAYSVAGLMALAARAGWEVDLICASFGERGKRHDGGRAGREALASGRAAELAASCIILGARPPRIWGLPDGQLSALPDGPQRVADALTTLGPGLVVTLGADGAYGHPDHLTVHGWVRDAWEGLGRPAPLLYAAFPAGLFLPQWEKVRAMLGEPPSPSAEALGVAPLHYAVDLAAVRSLKRAAIAAHRTQLPGGEPEALFPAGIIASLMATEWFSDAAGGPFAGTEAMLRALQQ